MPHYLKVGDVPPKRHTQFRQSDGSLYREELVGEEGFSGSSSLLYHRHIPSTITGSVPWEPPTATLTPNHPLLPRHLKTQALPQQATDVVSGREVLLGNADVLLSWVVATEPSELYRSAVGDELVFVQSGTATLETMFGALEVGPGDLVVIPRATTHRWLPDGSVSCLVMEAVGGHVTHPQRYLSATGQFRENSPYCERDLRVPTTPLVTEATDVDVLVKQRGGLGTRFTYAQHPFDVVGWDGALYPYVFNVRDFEPITGRIHQPPTVHQVFEGPRFVVCAFVPRKVDYHPLSIPVPYWHSNVDSDEVLFYSAGNYEARKGSGIGAGSISLHPGGHSHGPQPGAVEGALGVEYFDETAIMLDTFAPLLIGPAAPLCEDPAYAWSWNR